MNHHNLQIISLVFVFVFVSAFLLASSEQECSDELVRFSVCLPFVSASPNNLTDTPPVQCCTEFSSAQSLCLCYLLRTPPMLAFPINSSRFFQLPSLCPNASEPNFSIESLCSGSPVLPPLHSITGLDSGRPRSRPEQQSQADSDGELDDNVASEPAADSPTEPKTEMPTSNSEMPTSNPEFPTSTKSSTTMLMKDKCHCIPLSVIMFCLPWSGTSYLMNI